MLSVRHPVPHFLPHWGRLGRPYVLLERVSQLPPLVVSLHQELTTYPVLADTTCFPPGDVPIVHRLLEHPVAAVCSAQRISHLRELYGTKTWSLGREQLQEIEVPPPSS